MVLDMAENNKDPKLKGLKKIITDKKSKDGSVYGKKKSVDMKVVDDIVSKMKKKYASEGLEMKEAPEKLEELRGIISEGKTAKLEIKSYEDVETMPSKFSRSLGNLYIRFKGVLHHVVDRIMKLPQIDQLDFYLYSANMKYGVKQYVALMTIAAVIVAIVTGLASALLVILLAEPALLIVVPIVMIFAFLLSIVVGLYVPKMKAQGRSDAISAELPFALRHMATELKAGIGLYRTIQTIAAADYGPLSEEFARTIIEIEQGTDTKVALKHLRLRTQSKGLKRAIQHIDRALKTGGNLSETMSEIAEDVSFEMRMAMRDFAEKMNFFGVIYIVIAIVLPVFVAILAGIRAAPLQAGQDVAVVMATQAPQTMFSALPLGPEIVALIYLFLMPIIFITLIVYLKSSQPKV